MESSQHASTSRGLNAAGRRLLTMLPAMVWVSFTAWLSISGCGAKTLGPNLAPSATHGVVESPVTKQRYAVYLPKKPIVGRFIVGFTPDGDAAALAERLSEAAEKNQAVVLVPHGLKDGPWAPIETAQKNLTKDLNALNSKPTETFAVGFSGGARMAMRFAYQQRVAGVVACGGFFPWNVMPTDPPPPPVVGLVGESDLGRSEMQTAEQFLAEQGAFAWFETFSGKHEWPSAELLSRAITRLHKQATLPIEPELLRAQRWLEEKPHWALHHARQLRREYANTSEPHDLIEEWMRLPAMQRIAHQLDIIEALQTTTDPAEFDRGLALARRLASVAGPLQQRSRTLVEGIHDVLAQRAVLFAREGVRSKATALLRLVVRQTPEEPSLRYNMACAFARVGDSDHALSELQRAFELGWRDRTFAKLDGDFAALKNDPRFRALVD